MQQTRFFIDAKHISPHEWGDIVAIFIADIMKHGSKIQIEFIDWNNYLGVEHSIFEFLDISNISHSNKIFSVSNNSPRAYINLLIYLVCLFDWGVRIYGQNLNVYIHDEILSLEYLSLATVTTSLQDIHNDLCNFLTPTFMGQ